VVLEKDVEDDLDLLCKKWSSITHNQGRKANPTYNKAKKTNWVEHILHRNSLQTHVIEVKIQKR